MNNEPQKNILFTIANEIKRSLESPVIFLTMEDYSDMAFNTLVDIRRALREHQPVTVLLDIITDMYLHWVEAVKDLETFKERINTTPRKSIYKSIDTTIIRVQKKKYYFKRYLNEKDLTNQERTFLRAEVELIGDMQDSVIAILRDKLTCFQYQADQTEFLVKVEYELEELMNWVDDINNHLTVQLCKVLKVYNPELQSVLSMTLKEIIDQIASSAEPEIQTLYSKIDAKLATTSRFTAHDLEIKKVADKIKVLDSKIERLAGQHSSAVMALQHKKLYLQERLASLEKQQDNFDNLKAKQSTEAQKGCIVDHMLPAADRMRLVQELLTVWSSALMCQSYKSIISIVSATDTKEEYVDEFGRFKVDQHGRKIYTTDEGAFQLNEREELVPVADDEHVYFFDDCGRYYIDESGQHVYKHSTHDSEYVMKPPGKLYKHREIIDGVEFRYDDMGRYYIRLEDGKKIYKEDNADSEYEYDGLGNLVRLRPEAYYDNAISMETAPVMQTAETKYLQQNVAGALKECIVDVILHQPRDPIGFLAEALIKYRQNIEDREDRLRDEVFLMEERERIRQEEAAKMRQKMTADEPVVEEEAISYDSAYSYQTIQTK